MPSRMMCGALGIILLAAAAGQTQPDEKPNNLLVFGHGFAFGVVEPVGWHGDTDEIAKKYQANVVFQSPSEPGKNDLTIRVRVNNKVDEDTIEDLNYDMDGYKKEFPNVQFSDLTVAHPEYATFARTAFVPNQFYEYVAYVNPGTGKRFVLSIAMSKKGEPASGEELKAYETVLKSIVWLSR